jgi:hypothetical protein
VWEGDFAAAASSPPGVIGTTHAFSGGSSSNQLTTDPPFGITLQWSDKLGGSANDYDLYLFNSTLDVIYDVSNDVQDGDDDPVEFIDSTFFNDATNRLVVVLANGSSRYLHLNTHRDKWSDLGSRGGGECVCSGCDQCRDGGRWRLHRRGHEPRRVFQF